MGAMRRLRIYSQVTRGRKYTEILSVCMNYLILNTWNVKLRQLSALDTFRPRRTHLQL